ncbi:GNAT family N-acetyltransferase [Azotobacter chroococcum]|uniref:Acetyltransferase, GNAT family n=1 Tax=Azotobacter chroococcum NCIMB 8003 TaxID=1328314 RepID=A0A0C4WJ63_9GAMM|nr:N-acetyltransferase [Azotobacter chroococcum]AJE19904.1 Acetyltransferase, GNAT family [Azotobacter chroococcum NCIMB 8003]
MPLRIRREIPADIAPIGTLTAAAFLDAPHSSHTEHFIVDALRRAGQLSLSLVAESEGAIVGHIAVSPVSISDGSGGWYGLGPLSVAPEHQGRGIGSRLVEQALAALRRRGAAGCVVLGEPEYYGRFGFRAEPALRLPGVPPQYFQAIALREAMPTGSVSYQKAFEARS